MTIRDSDGGEYKWVKATLSTIDEEVRLEYQISRDPSFVRLDDTR